MKKWLGVLSALYLFFPNTGYAGPFSDEAISWDSDAGQNVFFPERGEPHLVLSGRVSQGAQLFFNERPAEMTDDKFKFMVRLVESSNDVTAQVKSTDGEDHTYKMVFSWKKLPPERHFKVKIREGAKVSEAETTSVARVQRADEWISVKTQGTSRFRWRTFEYQALAAVDRLGGFVASGYLGWKPEYQLGTHWNLSLGVGALLLKNNSSVLFSAWEYRLLLGYRLTQGIRLEAGAGGQTWLGVQPFILTFGGNLAFRTSWRLAREIVVGYSYVAHTSKTHLFRVGARFRL